MSLVVENRNRKLGSNTIDSVSVVWLSMFLISTNLALMLHISSYVYYFVYVTALVALMAHCLLIGINYPRVDLSALLVFPLIISALQNVYLGLISLYVSPDLTLALSTTVIYSLGLLVVFILLEREAFNKYLLTIFLSGSIIFIYGVILFFAIGGNSYSALASLRNVLAPFLFFLLGYVAGGRCNLSRLCILISVLGVFIIVFGFIERFMFVTLWQHLNVSDLWPLKGIYINPITGYPSNFYASELVGGVQPRRMVSSYADPINFGTVLFLIFMVSWLIRHRILMVMSFIAAVLAFSKGALLGFCIFTSIWAYYKGATKFLVIILGNLCLTVAFVWYSINNSTGSLKAHVFGFWNSLIELIQHPIGRGPGNIGVLAGLFSPGAESKINETGIGMILGELGVVGFLFYCVFIYAVWKRLKLIGCTKFRIFSLSLLLSIVLNICFNEVALSPNSCGGYFLLLGLCSSINALESRRPVVVDLVTRY